MAFIFFAAATWLVRILTQAAKILAIILAAWLLYRLICRIAIGCFYNRITRVTIYRKKEIIGRYEIPTGCSRGYYHTTHYKYVHKQEGTKYKTRIYLGNKFFILYSFRDSDKLFLRLLDNAGISLNSVNEKMG